MLRRGQPDVHPAAREEAVPGRSASPVQTRRTPIYSGRRSDNDGRIVDEDAEGRTLLWHAALHDDALAKVLLEPAARTRSSSRPSTACRRCSSRRSIRDGPRACLSHVTRDLTGTGTTTDGRVVAVAARLLPRTSSPSTCGSGTCCNVALLQKRSSLTAAAISSPVLAFITKRLQVALSGMPGARVADAKPSAAPDLMPPSMSPAMARLA